jgi:hypothetical protein
MASMEHNKMALLYANTFLKIVLTLQYRKPYNGNAARQEVIDWSVMEKGAQSE